MTSTSQRSATTGRHPGWSDADRILRSAADLVARSVALGAITAVVAFLLGFGFPTLVFIGPYWLVLLPAAAAGGVGAAAMLAVARALGWNVRSEKIAVLTGAAVLGSPMPFAFAAVFGPTVGLSWWLWFPAAVVVAAFAYRQFLRDPMDGWRPVLVRLLFGSGLALGALGFSTFAVVGAWPSWAPAVGWRLPAPLVAIIIAGALGLGALLVSVGPFPTRAARAASWGGTAFAIACITALMLGLATRPGDRAPEPAPAADAPVAPDAWGDPQSGNPGDQQRPDMPMPSVDEGRHQFAALAEATVDAAGADAIWRDSPAAPVLEEACDGGIRFRIDAELAMGVITDTTTDEHDRDVTERNLAAADRIVRSWAALGLGTAEIIHGEPILGGAALGAVDYARVNFEFGVAQPRIEGRCLPTG
jgi:hypothetical protein